MTFHIPQIIFLAISFAVGGMHLARHGERRRDDYNFGLWLFCFMLELWILWAGGFFG